MSEPDPVAAMLAMHDTYRMEECEFLYDKVRQEKKRVEKRYGLNIPDMTEGFLDGLDFVMNVLDERITDLQKRWQ